MCYYWFQYEVKTTFRARDIEVNVEVEVAVEVQAALGSRQYLQ